MLDDALWLRFQGTRAMRKELSEIVEDSAKEMVESIKDMIPAVGIRVKSGSLQNAVKYEMRSMLHARIFVDARQAPYAGYLEYGYNGFDMKQGLLKRSKISSDGHRYKVIPIGQDDGYKFVTISDKNEVTKAGKQSKRYARSWKHPGYTGKLFFQQGIEEVMPNIVTRIEKYMTEATGAT